MDRAIWLWDICFAMAVNPHLKIHNLVDSAVGHELSVPEFQRGFVWKPAQTRDLAESLWLDYPIGSLLIWNSRAGAQERVVTDARTPAEWLVDGQQRTTALCILFGRKPYWWPDAESWEKAMRRYDIRFDVEAVEPPFFRVADAAIRKTKAHRWIRLSELLVLDTNRSADSEKLMALARTIKIEGLCGNFDAMQVYASLDRVRKIREKDLVTITVEHELEDVVEIFARLNSRGTRVTEADIYLGIVAARSPGWVRDEFLPFLNVLRDSGFDVNPNLLFRSVTAIAAGKTRFRDIQDSMWDTTSIGPAWKRTQKAWKSLVKRLAEYGILSNEPLPTEAALVTLVAIQDKFQDEASFDLPFYWLLQASRFGRYSGSGTTALDEDLRAIGESTKLRDAVVRLLERFEHRRLIELEDFMADYGDSRFGRFLLYILVWHNGARDWDVHGYRLGFDGAQVLAEFQPQWHHIFPKKFLGDRYDEPEINALANIAVIGPSINIRISAKNPMEYLQKYKITNDKLAQQFIPSDLATTPIEKYPSFLKDRTRQEREHVRQLRLEELEEEAWEGETEEVA
jgi:hypothetical protein